MNAQRRGIKPLINHPARRAVSGRRVRRIAVALVLVGAFAQPVTAQDVTPVLGEPWQEVAPVQTPLKWRVALPVVMVEMMRMP
jgi:tyrosine-protein phosphatase YwqE